ncbi:EpsG family protein [Bacteroides caecimuris]|uniref:EpsG family protein n=1 Tax=Bacteroides caecimuris TaxID=1796613 RepID=UPI002573F7DD|nr:EpsG family protein [Bacteroides caecimuris]
MIYYLFFWLLFALALMEVLPFNQGLGRATKRFLFSIMLLLMILFAGLRNEIGIDYFGYEGIYQAVRNGSLGLINRVIEPFMSILFKILPSFTLCVLVIATMAIIVKESIFFKFNDKYVFTALFFYYASEFLFYDMGIIRQGLAIGICLLSIKYLKDKDIRFFALIFFATMIHISSAVFGIMWLVNNKEYSRKVYYGVPLATLGLYMSGKIFTSILSPLMSGTSLIAGKIEKFSTYADADITVSIIRRIAFLLLFVEIFKKDIAVVSNRGRFFKRESTENTWVYINMFFLSTVLLSFFGTIFSMVAGRMTECFYISYIFLYMQIFSDRRKPIENIILFAIFSLLAFLTFEDTIVSHNEIYLPYRSILGL